jgi:HAMP domain-containing protein
MRRGVKRLCLCILLGAVARGPSLSMRAQTADPRVGTRGSHLPEPDDMNINDQSALEMARKQRKALNLQRQRQLVSDTDKLVRLATELRSDVNRTKPAESSTAGAQKADEIEKLARSVRDKMKAF